MAANCDPAVATIHRLTLFERQSRWRLVEQDRHLGEGGRPVLLQLALNVIRHNGATNVAQALWNGALKLDRVLAYKAS